MIEQADYEDWLVHPVTKAFLQVLASKRADLRNEWEQSNPTSYTKDEFVLASVGNIGWCRGLAFAETLDYEGYLSEVDPDGKSKRPEAPGGSGAT